MTGNDIKKIRKRLKYSQRQFAAATGVNLRTLQGWEQGHRQISTVSQKHLRLSLRMHENYLHNQGIRVDLEL